MKIRYISPVYCLWVSLILMYIIPVIYFIVYIPDYYLASNAFTPFIICSIMYCSIIFIMPGIFKSIQHLSNFNFIIFRTANFFPVAEKSNYNSPINAIYRLLTNILIIISLTIFFYLGLPKLLLLGSYTPDVGAFRILGYDDRSRILTAILEILRRIVWPFTLLNFLVKYHINNYSKKIYTKSGFYLFLVTLTFFLVSIINLDRGPIFTFFVFLAYYQFVVKERPMKFVLFMGTFFFIFLSFVGGYVTFLQYNNTYFTFDELINQSQNIILKRAVLDPVVSSYALSFDIFREGSEKLMFEHSRLFSIFTGNYVGTSGAYSIFVAPAGIVGDAWRNAGYVGVGMTALFISIVFYYFEIKFSEASYRLQIPGSFLVLFLSMYLVYGGLFSLGPFSIITVIIILLKYDKRKFSGIYSTIVE